MSIYSMESRRTGYLLIYYRCSDLGKNLLTLGEGLLEASHHVEGVLWVVITSTLEKRFEGLDGLGQLAEGTWNTGEELGHLEWLGEHLLDLSGSGDGKSILFGQLIHTKNGDNILE